MAYAEKKEILQALYRHMILTTNQLAIYLNYPLLTLDEIMEQLKEQGLVRSISLSFLEGNQVGFMLSAYGAKAAASLSGEEEVFRSKVNEHQQIQLERVYRTNAFFISLIRHSLVFKGEGLIEWQSNHEVAETYAHFKDLGQELAPLRPDGLGIYLIPGRGKLILHLQFDNSSENGMQLKDTLRNYGRWLSSIWLERGPVHVLFLTQNESRAKRLLECWHSLCKDPLFNKSDPMVWAISEKDWKQAGVSGALWSGVDGRGVLLKDMPVSPLPPESNLPIAGKRRKELLAIQKNQY
jgi:hypothetical protein